MQLQIFDVTLVIGILLMVILCLHLGDSMFKKSHFLFIMTMLFAGVVILGNLLEYNSLSLDGATVSRKFSYFGSCFAEWFFFLFVLEYMEYKKPKLLIYTLFLIHIACFSGVMCCEKNGLFYETIDYANINNVGMLITTPGPLAIMHRLSMIFYIIMIPVICARYYFTHKTEKRRSNMLFLISCVILPAVGYIGALLNWTGPYDFTGVLFAVAFVVCFFKMFKGHMLDTVDIARDNLITNLEDAVIVLDSNMQVLYMNEKSNNMFPDIKKNIETYELVSSLCREAAEQFSDNGRTYNLHISNIYSRNQVVGYTLIFSDVTDLVDYADELEREVNNKVSEIERIQHQVLVSFANMIEMRDGMTGKHVKRTGEYVKVLAEELYARGMYADELNEKKIETIVSAAALHDIGKIAISDMILQKPGRLTDEEFDKIKEHSSIGGDIIEDVLKDVGENEYLREAQQMATYHHEKWNGEGYPEGLEGEKIPLSARIMAVADVFDALISKRQYKEAYTMDKAFSIMEESKGSHFDPEIVQVFIDSRDKIEKVVYDLRDD